MINIESLVCSFENKIILNNINLSIKNHLSILGANGSGKSTFAKAVSSLISYKGDIYIDSQNIKELSLSQKAQLITYIPAKLEIYDTYISLEEFVLLGRFPYKKSFLDYSKKDKKLVQDTLQFLNIQNLKTHTIHSLSSGEQQLALIASALVQKSKIIIFDEPTANLDPRNSKIIAKHIKELKKSHTIFLITHDLQLASFIDSPVAFIKKNTLFYHEDDFFNDSLLQTYYEVKFKDLGVSYD